MKCSACGRQVEKVPAWLADVKVNFICNNCPNRQAKNIAFMSLESEVPAKAKLVDGDDDLDVEDITDKEDEELEDEPV